MFKKIALAFLSLMAVGQFALAMPAMAQVTTGQPGQDVFTNLNATGLGGSSADAASAGKKLPILIGNIIKTVMAILGIIVVVLIVFAGFQWMTARGDSGVIDTAKDTIRNAVIGLILIFLAYAITGFVINAIVTATTSP